MWLTNIHIICCLLAIFVNCSRIPNSYSLSKIPKQPSSGHGERTFKLIQDIVRQNYERSLREQHQLYKNRYPHVRYVAAEKTRSSLPPSSLTRSSLHHPGSSSPSVRKTRQLRAQRKKPRKIGYWTNYNKHQKVLRSWVETKFVSMQFFGLKV